MRKLTLAGATLNQTPFDWKHNTANILQALEKARKNDVDLLCFAELTLTGYGCEDVFLSDWLAETAWQKLLEIREHCSNITVAIGLPIRINGKTYNGACLIHDKKILGITLKQNLPKDGVHYEPRWFEAWKAGEVISLERAGEKIQAGDLVYDVNGVRIAFEICEDAWVTTNRPGDRLCKQGVDIMLNPSASHFAMSKSTIREELIRSSSEKFNCTYLYVNQLGNEAGRIIYDGDVILAQRGTIKALNRRLTFQNNDVLCCAVDIDQPEATVPVIENDSKEKNEELAQAVSLALYDYLRKSKAKGFVLSLSGGADSSIIATFVAEMVRRGTSELGTEIFCKNLGLVHEESREKLVGQLLTCVYQGTRNSSTDTLQAAEELAKSLGATFHHWEIEAEVNSYSSKIEKAIGRNLTWEKYDIAMQNIQARSRSPIIWMLANIKQALLLTTSNRSEGNVGYATMDGDTSGSLAPIAGLSKPFVLQWLQWAETVLGYKGLSYVNQLKPTAELRPLERHQTDEADLMPYSILEQIELLAIKERKPPKEVYAILSQGSENEVLKTYIKKYFRLWSINQWKRERLAPSFHLDELNVDPRSWCRFPILSGSFEEELNAL
ncbi:MAG: NAD(+) synthase [Cytophagia bacterium]|nr:NAD(+) synthase [Cytophagia bacterium]